VPSEDLCDPPGIKSAILRKNNVNKSPLGLIAGTGKFPVLVAQVAASRGIPLVIAAIREEASRELEKVLEVDQRGSSIHWIGLGQLGKLIRIFKGEGVEKIMMAGQVRHSKIFAPNTSASRKILSAMPDITMVRMLMALPEKSTSALIGGVIGVLKENGMEIVDSTELVKDLLAPAGVITDRAPSREEMEDIEYGRPIAQSLAGFDLGQSIIVKDKAVVAVEAMEGTDQAIIRASSLVGGQSLTLIKVARPSQEMRFDVPVLGLKTLEVLEKCNVTAVSIDAGKTLLLDKERLIEGANSLGISLIGQC
jgi:DUF1009 family protein